MLFLSALGAPGWDFRCATLAPTAVFDKMDNS
jgi:hypothetical protein